MKQELKTTYKELEKKLNTLKDNKEISYWTIVEHSIEKSNIYVEKEYRVESVLEGKRKSYDVTLFKAQGDEMYKSTFTLAPDMDEQEMDDEIDTALFSCQYAQSRQYTLPQKNDTLLDDSTIDYGNFYDEKTFSDIQNGSIHFFLEQLMTTIKTLIDNSQEETISITLNNLELLTTAITNTFTNSEEVHKSYLKDTAYLEFVITAKDLNTQKETEHVIYETINSLYEFDYETFFKQAIATVLDTTRAQKPPQFEGRVVLGDTACKDFFTPDLSMNAFIAHCSAKLKYDGISNYEEGKKIVENDNDSLTVYSNPLIQNNNASTPFDSLGIAGKKVCLIENNNLKQYFASKQYADYLGIEPTGPLGVIEIEAGEKSEQEIRNQEEYIEIITFSSFVPDMVSGNFSAEIRMGYYVKNGKKIPFKGGLFSGNIFDLLKQVWLSKEVMEKPGFKGPKSIAFDKGIIIGEEN